ncbi:MAG: hypothetical protein N3A53_04250 [Verrucomicrobiae bacterium]|nr:hypothetical protein [Verrucomicrobiae bacterium]MDW8344147.1 hypothetical protein [Verrucomicrobiae bacterium]
MREYRDPGNKYTLEYPDGWLPLTHEGSTHVSLASLTTGGFLRIEAHQFDPDESPEPDAARATLEALVDCERRHHPELAAPRIIHGTLNGSTFAHATFTRPEAGASNPADFGHTRAWVLVRGAVQVRCLYRCRCADIGVDDDDLDAIIRSLVIHDIPLLDADRFARYYYSVLKHKRPMLAVRPPKDLTLMLEDGQAILLEHLYNHYLLEPERMDELIETHIHRLDYCGDDVPDLTNYRAIRPLLFPKILRAPTSRSHAPHRIPFWPGLAIGAVVQGRIFTYGVNAERLKNWGVKSLREIFDDLLDNLYAIPPVSPRGLRDADGNTRAISYVDHPFSASFILFEDFYETTAHNLGAEEFLVGLPDPGCVSCYRDDDPRFVVQHTALLRWDYHRSIERLTDTIYLVTGSRPQDVKPYDILHCCPKKV